MHTTIASVPDEALDVSVTDASTSLLEHIGGVVTVERLVDRFIHRTLNDRQLAPHFAGIDVAALRQSQVAFFCAAFGGTTALDWRSPAVDLDDEPFSRVISHLYDVLVSLGLPERLTERLVIAVISLAFRAQCRGD